MIQEFIQNHFLQKLGHENSLTVYDPDLLYHDLVIGMQNENLKVFDISKNTVTERERAFDYWVNEMPLSLDKKMLIYIPFRKKLDEDQKARDPFSIFMSAGAVFPDEASDSYKQLCLQAIPEKAAKIEELFLHSSTPSFSKIDALKGGNTYPSIKAGLDATSAVEILLAFLNPNENQLVFLKSDNSWKNEFKEFMADVIGVTPTKKSIDTLRKELWRIVLFSEFLYDLPVDLPSKLADVSKAKEEAKTVIYQVCDHLRKNKDCEELYVKHAGEVSDELSLADLFRDENDLGSINTFAFEDSTFFNQFKDELLKGNLAAATSLAKTSSKGIWSEFNDERRAAWQIGLKTCELVAAIENQKNDLKGLKNTNSIIHWYSEKGFTIDALHRELQKEIQKQIELSDALEEVVNYGRKAYHGFMEGVQKSLQNSIEKDKGIQTDILKNSTLFDTKVKPLVNEGKKTVYILADALRFELGDYLKRRLSRADFDCTLIPSLAFMPTVTKYAMAALMPEASRNLELNTLKDDLQAYLNGKLAKSRADRIKYTQEVLGDKCAWHWEDDILRNSFEKKDILFVTTTEVDQAGENTPQHAQHLIELAIQKILKVTTKLKKAGYEEFIVAADHGFVLYDEYLAGNNVSKPTGEWVLQKTRCLAGKGETSDNHLVFTPEQLGVKSDVEQFMFLKNYAVYERGKIFFHEGLSLQEIITPCLSFRPIKKKEKEEIVVNLSYKGKTKGFVTTRRPSIEVACFGDSFFAEAIDVQIEAIANELHIGNPAPSEEVNTTTGFVEVSPGQSLKITLALEDDFEGAFTVYAKSPSTGIIYSQIELETEYL